MRGQATRMTADDLLALPEDGLRHELIDGEHYVTPSPRYAHQAVVGNLHLALGLHLRGTPVGVAVLGPFDIVLSRYDVVVPDLVYFTNERLQKVVGEQNAQGPPNLAIEVLSPSTRRRDEVLKRRLYERSGVDEYWLVDPELATVKIYRAEAGRFTRTELSVEDGDVLKTPLLEGFALPLRAVFEIR